MLVASLLLVAAPAEQQILSLPDFVVVTDEVVSMFGDAYLLVRQLNHAGLISSDALSALRELEEYLESMPHDERLQYSDSLSDHPFWKEARRLALFALTKLGEEMRPPSFPGTTWVKG